MDGGGEPMSWAAGLSAHLCNRLFGGGIEHREHDLVSGHRKGGKQTYRVILRPEIVAAHSINRATLRSSGSSAIAGRYHSTRKCSSAGPAVVIAPH